MKKIAFHANQLGLRGTEVALYAYAKYNEEILGNKSVICITPDRELTTLPKFQERFKIAWVGWSEYGHYLPENNFDYLYALKMGTIDGGCVDVVPTLVHVVFRHNQPHGHKYVYVSDWLAEDQGYKKETHSVPHICERLPEPSQDLRSILGISKNKTVFGCYAGETEFNIGFVHDVIKRTVEERSDIEFIFMNITPFANHPRIHFLPGNYDLKYKSSFVEACDAMIHARVGGETFGLAVAEFTLSNKPVITYALSGERCHLDILGERAILYQGYEDFYDIINDFPNYNTRNDYYLAYKDYSPEIIMEKFNRIFLS